MAKVSVEIEDEAALPYARLRSELAAQSRRGQLHPVLFGSAMTGEGIDALFAATGARGAAAILKLLQNIGHVTVPYVFGYWDTAPNASGKRRIRVDDSNPAR